ncbi:MAG: nitrile hydratase subunit beta [Alphaproteobacteria bacterium]
MDGAHDMGGMHGFGRVVPEPEDERFHWDWERRAFALTLACGMLGRWNIDMSRFAREDADPAVYLRSTYYEQWLRGLRRLLVERGLISAEELASGKAAGPGAVAAVPAERVPAILRKGTSASRPGNVAPRFRPGDAVRVRNLHPRGHTRMPRYVRGKVGVIERGHGLHVFPDSNARGDGEAPQHCYAVRFASHALWGDGGESHAVLVDLWDEYLEPA